MRIAQYLLSAALLLIGGCATTLQEAAVSSSTVDVPAVGETVPVATANSDAADDPAIFARTDNAAFAVNGKRVEALILGTDKKAGLYAFALDGKAVQFLPEGLLNNVDLRSEGDGFIAGASNRTPGHSGVSLYRYTGSGGITDAGFFTTDLAEPYGFCMGRLNDSLVAIVVGKHGAVREFALQDEANGSLTGREIARFEVGSQSEGCVVDDSTGALYIGEEDVGVWRYSLGRSDGARISIAKTGNGALVADVEGMSILTDGAARYLIVSSQGDSAFAVWRIDGATPQYAGRFHVAAANGVDEVTGTDGVDAHGGAVGGFPSGLVVVQDDVNDGAAQNFKLVDWRAIKAALKP
ncbi:phytase [Stakelama sp. CBK3Z-3]|uniref:Phytase n=1 Tax=Stakelama flava TaxID=2860338 RepID=A0ABS6XKX3_9SPHN|nr:phytase [Stakelama flava]MBW4330860.1 phytase [Stakelama flava]